MYRVATDLRVVIDRLEDYELHFEDEFRAEIDFARPFFDEEDEDAASWMKMLKDVDLKWRDADATTREKREAAKLSKKKAKHLTRQVMLLEPYFTKHILLYLAVFVVLLSADCVLKRPCRVVIFADGAVEEARAEGSTAADVNEDADDEEDEEEEEGEDEDGELDLPLCACAALQCSQREIAC
jgi:hypothetical protein